jgi:DNA-binding GntR family transcriptional regulator
MTGDRYWPRYLRVAQLMRQAIGNGVYPTGSALPSTAQLAETYGVSPTVIGAVLRESRSEGLVSGRAGEIISVVDEPGSASSSCLDG